MIEFVSPGDAVIVSSGALVEADLGLGHAQLETRLEELTRRLAQALLQQIVLDRIASTKSRCFALGSVTLNGAGNKQILHFQTMLDRQAELVSDAVGALATEDLPIFIATSIDEEDHEMLGAVLDVIAYITCKSGFWRDVEIVSASEVFCVAPNFGAARVVSDALELIALWPLKAETVRRGMTQRCLNL